MEKGYQGRSLNLHRVCGLLGRTWFKYGVAVLFILGGKHLSAAVLNGVDFGVVYQGSILPTTATPAWLLSGGGSAAAYTSTPNTPTDGILQFTTATTGSRYYFIKYENASSPWNGSTAEGTAGSTVEFRLKIDSMNSDALRTTTVALLSGQALYTFNFNLTSVSAATTINLDTTVFHTYRITLDGNGAGTASLYIDNSATPVISGYSGTPTTANEVRFGDLSSSTGGTSEWEYFAFTNSGSFAPIPEPSTLLLMGAALAVLITFRVHRRKLA